VFGDHESTIRSFPKMTKMRRLENVGNLLPVINKRIAIIGLANRWPYDLFWMQLDGEKFIRRIPVRLND
jgi:hypothetical protein